MTRNFTFVAGTLIVLYGFYQLSELTGIFLGIAGLVVLLACAIDLIQGLGILLFAIALSPEIQLAGLPIRIEDLILPVILFFWILQMGTKRTKLKPTNLKLPIFAFLFFMLISTINAIIVNPNLEQIQAIFHFLKHVEYIFIFLIAFNVVNSKDDLRFLTYCLVGAACVLALHASVPFLSVVETVQQASERVRGVATETANIFGGYLVFHILFGTGVLIEEDSVGAQTFLTSGIILMLYPLLFTLSRSSYVGLIAGFLFIGFFHAPKIIFGGSMIGFGLYSLVPTQVIARFTSIFVALSNAELASSWDARLDSWAHHIPYVLKNPFIGKGLYFVPPGYVDNELVLRLVETGVFGTLAFVWLFWGFATRSRELWKSDETIFRQIGIGYLAGLVGLSFHSLAATSFTTIRTAEPLYFASGLVLAGYLLYFNVGSQHTTHELKRKEEESLNLKIRKKANIHQTL